jgi:N-methylhydantoinase A
MWKLGVDVGGTFTDLCLLNADSGEVWIEKTPSTPEDQSIAFIVGIERVAQAADLPVPAVDFLVHGTTVATNSLLEHKGAKTGLITSEGFRDVLEIGTQQRPLLYSLTQQKPAALVRRRLRREVAERVAADGAVVKALDEEGARRTLEELRAEGVESLAICLLFSFMNTDHEERLAALARELLPGVMISTSCTISPEYREYWRMSTTAVNAYVMPPVFGYIDRLERRLDEAQVEAKLHVMQSSGGLMTSSTTKERPVNTILSGPVGGVVGATFFGTAAGYPDLVTFDMGGTSCDVATVVGGEAGRTMMKDLGGYPLRTPMIDIETIGAGGGSIARVDEAGALKVGPESAGALPGPACYGRGGTQATVSDANLVVGVLGESTVLGRDLRLSIAAAREAVREHVATPLGTSVEEAAAGIIAITNSSMLGAIRLITVEKGLDPRDFAMLAFGGAGPMHACGVAREARIPRVIIPPHPGITSAVGLLMTDIRHPMVSPYIVPTARADLGRIESIFAELTKEAERKLLLDGISPDMISFRRFADMRYYGQAYELTIPCEEPLTEKGAVERLVASFHEHHERVYGHHASDEPTQFVSLRVEGVGEVPRGVWREKVPPERVRDETRSVYVIGAGWLPARVMPRGSLESGRDYTGPLIVEQLDTTTWIPPSAVARADDNGNLIVEVAL